MKLSSKTKRAWIILNRHSHNPTGKCRRVLFFSKRQQEPPRVWKHECGSSGCWLVGAHVNLPAFEMWQRRMADAAQASAAKDSLAGSPLSARSARDNLLDSPGFPLRFYLPHQRSAETSLKCLLADTRTSPQTQPSSFPALYKTP